MKGGGYSLQQSLTPEAANVVKQAVSLARRRGHAQVTPLHVASALLASSTAGLLKRACLQSHSHPLQYKALELCFNVALNRLPTSASTPLLAAPHPHCHIPPSLSNALVAAFKRAQAHQRRGSIETTQQQQQSILALKVEIEQLVVSILDDPSVSRVMREAGFSSTQVKANVEKTVSIDKCSSRASPPVKARLGTKCLAAAAGLEKVALPQTTPPPTTSLAHFTLPLYTKADVGGGEIVENDDGAMMGILIRAMMDRNTKNSVIVAESPAVAENVVRKVIQAFNRKDDAVPADMRFVQFISVPLFTLRNISREEFEIRLGELRSLVKSYMNRGVVLYLGDLDWVSNFWSSQRGGGGGGCYCPVEYMVMELSRMICGEKEAAENKKRPLWLMGAATPQTYAKCRLGRPSLETLWCLHPLRLPVPNSTLALNLSLDSTAGMYDQVKEEEDAAADDFNWLFLKAGIRKQLVCCSDCSDNFKKEAQSVLISDRQELRPLIASSSSLPSWLQQCMVENRKHDNSADQECAKIKDLCKKWNSICRSVHRRAPHFLFNLSSPSPSPSPPSSTSTSSSGHKKPHDNKLHYQSLLNWPAIFNEPIRESDQHKVVFPNVSDVEVSKPILLFPSSAAAAKPDLLSNPNSSPNSASSSEASQELGYCLQKFKEFTSDNLGILSNALERKVPWQRDIIRDIASTVLKCRSGMMRSEREDCWLFFLGADCDGKEIVAREIAKTVFGSHDSYISIGIGIGSSNYTTRADEDSAEEVSNKRARTSEHGGSCRPYDRFVEAVQDNPRRVFYIDDVGHMDYSSLKGFKRAVRNGHAAPHHPDGKIVFLRDAIVIFGSDESSRANCSPPCPISIDQVEVEVEVEGDAEKGSSERTKEEDIIVNGDGDDQLKEEQQQQFGIWDLNISASGEGEAGDDDQNYSLSENGILELVDKQVVFTIQVL
ncbi:protein SMAX1-LIKE 3-like [Andrographis paniculata]|uniref:protein SMAX1-LIKE 3-like n=1 Tax=Andrographis paniculata TaxID=175694 RepID=UPI0021E99E56|nr:protein SMAX1-LIKE 3-like [Andrographis paniculata]